LKASISEGIFNSSFKLNQKLRRQVVELGLRINNQQPDCGVSCIEVDNARAATLALPAARPANLAAPAAALDDVASQRVDGDLVDEFDALGIAPYVT
jgi:hypothetical protein